MNGGGLEEIRAARRELGEVIDEIRKVPGHKQFLASAAFKDVAEADRERPVVYPAAADEGGLGPVVRRDDVIHTPFTAQLVRDHVAAYFNPYQGFLADRKAGLAGWRAALDDIAAWPYEVAVGRLIEEIHTAPAIAMVGGGLLSLLPLPAAWTGETTVPTGRRHALDATAISYAPSARSLTAARDIAAASRATRLVAVVDPPRCPPAEPPGLAAMEARAAAAGFAGSAELLAGPIGIGAAATVSNVEAALRHTDMVHLACHGLAELATPLDSGLLLADQGVHQLRDLLALSLRVRRALLSACETAIPGTDLPDEVIALPTGMLQAGVAGIVASMWAVPDAATAMLMTEFYRQRRWERLLRPPHCNDRSGGFANTTNADKRELRENALDNGAGWLPPSIGEPFPDEVTYREPDDRDEQDVDAWAAFSHVGA